MGRFYFRQASRRVTPRSGKRQNAPSVQLGIGSYAFTWAVGVPGYPPRNPLTALGLCQLAVRLGVRVVQFADNLSLAAMDPRSLDDVEDFARRHALAIELGTRGIRSGDLSGHLRLAQRLGATFVRLVIDAPGEEPSPEEAVELLAPWVEKFAHAGVRIALENHDRFSACTLAGIVARLGPGQVGITLDTVNSFGALEAPSTVVRCLAPYALNLHLKDFTIRRVPSQMGFVIEGCPAGSGRLDVPWLLSELARLNPNAGAINAILELWTPFAATLTETLDREMSWAEESIRNLRSWIPD